MNQNSYIRRIDDLGRIVIPKDIRKKMRINNNDQLELFINNDEIIIKKSAEKQDIINYVKTLLDIGNRITGNKYIVTNKDVILASTDAILENNFITEDLKSYILSGIELKNELRKLILTFNSSIEAHYNLIPIVIDSEKSGLIIEYNEQKEVTSSNTIKIFKQLIEKYFN